MHKTLHKTMGVGYECLLENRSGNGHGKPLAELKVDQGFYSISH
jgi:hypothetical protein